MHCASRHSSSYHQQNTLSRCQPPASVPARPLTERKVERQALPPAVLHRLLEFVHLHLHAAEGQAGRRLACSPASLRVPTCRAASMQGPEGTALGLACQSTCRSSGKGRSSSIQPSPTAATLRFTSGCAGTVDLLCEKLKDGCIECIVSEARGMCMGTGRAAKGDPFMRRASRDRWLARLEAKRRRSSGKGSAPWQAGPERLRHQSQHGNQPSGPHWCAPCLADQGGNITGRCFICCAVLGRHRVQQPSPVALAEAS